MVFLCHCFSRRKFCSTICAVSVSCVAFLCACYFSRISQFCMLMSDCWDFFLITIITIFTLIKHYSCFHTSRIFPYNGTIIMFMIFFNCDLKWMTFTPISMFIPCIYMCIIYTELIFIITDIYMINIFSIL